MKNAPVFVPYVNARYLRIRIREGWNCCGRTGTVLGDPIDVNGILWTPILWDEDVEPNFHKHRGLALIQ